MDEGDAEILSIQSLIDEEADPGDFVFVLNGQGELKFVFIPDLDDDAMVPESVLAILKLFGIDSLDEKRMLH